MDGSRDDRRGEPAPDVVDASRGRPAGLRVALKTRADFLRVAKGSRSHAKAFSVQIGRRAADLDAPARFGLTVTRKVGGAVERNRIKRRLRAVLWTAALPALPGHDYVVVARREALSLPFDVLARDLVRALRPRRLPTAATPQDVKR